MILPRPSNNGILIGAALVGLLGLGATCFIQFAPKDLVFFNSTPPTPPVIQKKAKIKEPTEDLIIEDPQNTVQLPSAKKCVAELLAIEKRSKTVYVSWKPVRGTPTESKSKLRKLASQAERLNQLIQLDVKPGAEMKRRASLITLAITFRITQIYPAAGNESFQRVSEEILRTSVHENDRTRAAGLRLVVEQDFDRPAPARLQASLNAFSRKHQAVKAGVDVYAMIIQELQLRGHNELAHRIAKLGIKNYDGRAANRLFDFLPRRN